jgi:hypothetical protein
MKLTPTKEQQDIIDLAKQGNNLAIQAFAGAAKTSTCVMIAENIKQPSLYIAFNKTIATEANERFPFHVECRTLHSIAYEAIVKPEYKFKNKLQNWLNKADIDIGNLETTNMAVKIKQSIVDGITLFCQSDFTNWNDFIEDNQEYAGNVGDLLIKYWNDLINPKHPAKITHDVYLKLYHLSNPTLDCGVIYLDEAQDSNPVTLDIIMKQYHCQKIIVGDRFQAIYAWRGAVNAFDTIEKDDSFKKCYLTSSFRFTQEIANKASSLLNIIDPSIEIKGLNSGIVTGMDLSNRKDKTAIIVRNNGMLLAQLLQAEQNKEKVFVLADLKDLWSKMYHINSLYFKEPVKFPNAELVRFKEYKQLKQEAEYDRNLELLLKLLLNLSSGGLHNNITKIKSVIVDTPEEANFTLCTAHKSKGLEWDEVTLMDDLLWKKDEETLEECLLRDQCLELLYVALTRAKYQVNLPILVNYVIENGVN